MYTLEQKVELVMACLEGSGDYKSLDPSIREALELGLGITHEAQQDIDWCKNDYASNLLDLCELRKKEQQAKRYRRVIDYDRRIFDLLNDIGYPNRIATRSLVSGCIKQWLLNPSYHMQPLYVLITDAFPDFDSCDISRASASITYGARAVLDKGRNDRICERIEESLTPGSKKISGKKFIAICAEEVQDQIRRDEERRFRYG